MKISLQYFLNKQRITLKEFCDKNSLASYQELVNYCTDKNFVCVDKEFYLKSTPTIIDTSNLDNQEREIKVNEKKPAVKKRRSRKTPEKKQVRDSNKKSKP